MRFGAGLPDANEFSKKARPAVGGIDLNFTVRSITCDKVTSWSFLSSIAFTFAEGPVACPRQNY
jgi:hypothetical protein